jgi:hypothetical protein
VPQKANRATPEVGNDIKQWLGKQVSKAKRLEGGVHFIDAIPKNPVSRYFQRGLAKLTRRLVRQDSTKAAKGEGSSARDEGASIKAGWWYGDLIIRGSKYVVV